MKQALCSLFALMLIGSAACLAQPKIQATQQFSFGKVYKGSRPSQILTITNVGKDTLNISDVSAQCGCTAALISKQKIAPADSGKLSISFNTSSYEGPVTKRVYVQSNDPTVPKMTIEFTANVIQSISADPSFITFMISSLDTTCSKVVRLTNMTKQSIKILSVDAQMEGLKVSLLQNQLMPGEQTDLQITFHPVKPDLVQSVITLKTDDPGQSNVEIKLFQNFRRP
jgi:hypothetical protein